MKFIELLRQLQTSDHRFCAMSALISAASPEKNGWKCQVESDLGDNEYPPAEKPTWLSQVKRDPLSYKGMKKTGVKGANPRCDLQMHFKRLS